MQAITGLCDAPRASFDNFAAVHVECVTAWAKAKVDWHCAGRPQCGLPVASLGSHMSQFVAPLKHSCKCLLCPAMHGHCYDQP